MAEPRSGLRVYDITTNTLFFTLDGKYLPIPTMEVYNRLFPATLGPPVDIPNVPQEHVGETLGGDARVLLDDENYTQYFYNKGQKRVIFSWAFAVRAFGGHAQSVVHDILDRIPDGPPILDAAR